jgi:hypothetical protein
MTSFRNFLEGSQDNANRAEAIDIANKVIQFIGSPQNRYGKGLEYDREYGLKIGEIIPKYKNLYLKFINQPGFGKNQHLGLYNNSIISIALPQRTLAIALPSAFENGHLLHTRRTISDKVANALKKPNNYETFIHEIIHYLDAKRTKKKIFKNYPYGASDAEYYNHPSEYNANLQSFMARWGNKTLQELLEMLPKEKWFSMLNDKLKKHTLKRIALIKSQET